MSLNSGRLRHRIQLQKRIDTQDPVTGANIISWMTQKVRWAGIEPLSVRELQVASTTKEKLTARIVIRADAEIDGNWRALHNGKVYNIHGNLPDIDSGLEYCTLPVSEGVSDGE